ncbi:hypothetical protein CTM86_01925 [Fusobacterium pseudoperiodonticum]|uniref:Uncharacterized protein n=1 Tax=Fusobacterium pseudoperiodonticum TaxID=2663009 RepID=A0AAD0AQ02_9FUSO|nr:hypothetical protein [Fusobacterium pseudoperiodonticum]ATV65430.1 hypothetical protein CTM86_01925 [Fusobacterium pseudoperiodonticum]
MREYNFKASDSTGEMLMGLGFPFSFMGVAGLILTLRLILFPKIKYSSYVDNIYLEKFLIIVPALIITACLMKVIKKYSIKNYHIYEDKEMLKIENDKKVIELAYTAIKDIKFNKKGNKISKCYKLIIKTNSKDLKFFVRPKENHFGGATENDFNNLENFYLFLKEKISK